MAYPKYYPFKVKYLDASTTSTNSMTVAAVPARAELLGAWYATTPLQAQTATGGVTVQVNGTAVITLASITTSTGTVASYLGEPTTQTFLAAGDVLSTLASSVVGGTATFIVREF